MVYLTPVKRRPLPSGDLSLGARRRVPPLRAGSMYLPLRRHGLIFLTVLSLTRPCAPAEASIQHDLGDYLASQWTTEHGLPSNVVRGLAQGPDGYLWIATLSGLVRFDGVKFEVFDLENTPELQSAQVGDLVLDGKGRLWLHTYDGGVIWRTGDAFHPVLGREFGQIRRLARGAGDVVWAATPGGIARCREGRLDSLIAPGLDVWDILPVGEDSLWVATRDSLLLLHQGELRTITPIPSSPYGRIRRDVSGTIVHHGLEELTFVTSGTVVRLPRQATVARDLGVLLDGGFGRSVPDAYETDADGHTWFGSGCGLIRLTGSPFSPSRPEACGALRVLDPSLCGHVKAVLFTGDGSVWVGSESKGLFRIARSLATAAPYQVRWSKAGLNEIREPHCPWVLGFPPDGSAPRLSEVSGAPDVILSPWPLEPGILPRIFEARDGGAWIVHDGGLLHCRDGATTPISVPSEILAPGAEVFEDRDGGLWWGAHGGTYRLTDAAPVRVCNGRVIGQTRNGAIWIADNGDLVRWLKGSLHRFDADDGLPRGFIRDFWEDPDGRVWLATHGSGLACLVGDRFRVATIANGLPDNTVGGMLADAQGRLWINSNRGVFVLTPEALSRFANGESDVLPGRLVTHEESGSPWAARGGDGRLYFQTIKQTVVIDPDDLPAPASPPIARIDGIYAAGRRYSGNTAIRLPAGVRTFSVRYTAPTLEAPEQVRFRTRMSDLGREWEETGYRREAFFTHMPPGRHVFEVVAASAVGVWASRGSAIEVGIPARLDETIWFRGLLGLAAAGLVIGFFQNRARIHRRHLVAVEQEAERRRHAEVSLRDMGRRLMRAQENERRRIARELHDDIHQKLSLLAVELDMMASGTARDSRDLAEEAQEIATDIHRLSHSLHPDRLERLGLQASLVELCRDITIRSEVDVEGDIVELSREPAIEASLCAFRIAQEAIRNAVKHSGTKRITVRLRERDGTLHLDVHDEGRGFDMNSPPGRGLGLTSMEERAGALGGTVRITSAPEEGTTVSATVPAHPRSGPPQSD